MVKNSTRNVKILGTGSYCPEKVLTNKYKTKPKITIKKET